MFVVVLMLAYMSGFAFVLGMFPLEFESRPTLGGLTLEDEQPKKKQSLMKILRSVAIINKPICTGILRQRIAKDLVVAHVNISPEEFFLVKEFAIILAMVITYPSISPDLLMFWVCMCCAGGYMLPEFWLKGKIRRVKTTITRELPDAIDLLALCVNAGLDFMLALKWVVEKSPPSVMIDELNTVLQEINVGKTRREAIKDLARRYELPELSTFSRTLIQADKMGTSVTEALNILSEDMHLRRLSPAGNFTRDFLSVIKPLLISRFLFRLPA